MSNINKENLIQDIIDIYESEYPTASGETDEFYKDVINLIKNTNSGETAKTKSNNPIITKEIFVESMKKFVRTKEESDKMISNLYDTFGVPDKLMRNSGNYEDTFLNLLKAAMNDRLEWLDYYVYERECEWFEYHINNETVKVDSFDKLYELITTGDIKCDWRT